MNKTERIYAVNNTKNITASILDELNSICFKLNKYTFEPSAKVVSFALTPNISTLNKV